MAFDLLYVNDRSVMSLTGGQRMLMLKRCIKPKVTHHTHSARTFHFCDSPATHCVRYVMMGRRKKWWR
jgi:ATP-dependent DNA ligase